MVNESITKQDAIEKMAEMWNLLTLSQQQTLEKKMLIYHFKKNECLYKEGETVSHFMCLLNGKIKVSMNGIGGRSQIMRVIKPGDFFGYRSYFANELFSTEGITLECSSICYIPIKDFSICLQENARLSFYFLRHLSIDLEAANKRTICLTQKHIRGRLAESILFLKENYGLEEDLSTLSIYLSREDLACMSNMTTANAIRTLSNFAAEKIIAIDGKKIKLIDEEKLKNISRIG